MRLWKNSLSAIGRIVVLLMVASATLIIFFPGLLTKYMQIYANYKYLDPLGLRVSYKGFEGDLFGTMQFERVLMTTADGAVNLAAENVDLNIDFLRLIRRDLSFDEVRLEKLRLEIPAGEEGDWTANRELPELPWITIQNLTIDDAQIVQGDRQFWMQVSGHLDVSKDVTLKKSRVAIVFPEAPDTLFLESDLLAFSGESVVIQNGLLSNGTNRVELTGLVQLDPRLELDLEVAIEGIPPFPEQPQWITLEAARGRLAGPLDGLSFDVTVDMVARDDRLDLVEARFNLIPGGLHLDRVRLVNAGQALTVKGDLKYTGNLELDVDFEEVVLSNLLPELPQITLRGPVTIIAYREGDQFDSLDLVWDLEKLEYQGLHFGSIQGRTRFANGVWSVLDTTGLTFAGSHIELWGSVDVQRQLLDLEVFLRTDTLAAVLAAAGLAPISGRANGQIWGSGSLTDPAFTGAVMITDARYQGLEVGQAFVQFALDSALTHTTGLLNASTGDLSIFGQLAEGGEAEFSFAGDTVFINYFRLYNGFDKLATSGFMIRRDSIQLVLDTLTVIRNSEMLSAGRLQARWDVDRAVLEHRSFAFAGGVVSIAADWRDAHDFSFQLSTSKAVDIERFYRLLGRPPSIAGILDLHVSALNRDRDFGLSGNLIVREGHFNRIPFSKVKTEFELEDHRLSFPTLDWRTAEGQATINGTVTYLVDSKNPLGLGKADSLQFSSQLTDYQLNDLQPYLPWQYETHGLATGSFSVRGPVTDPVYEMQLAFKEPRFDRIAGDSLSGKMRYEDKTLSFSNLYLKTPTGVYAGSGTLPLDLRPGTPESEMIIDGPVDMTIAGIATQLDWLASYFEAIDSLHGDYKLNLALGGTWARLIRNGRLQVTNGRAELFVMENPITEITGDLLLQDNQFRVLYLSGHTPRESSGKLLSRIRKNVVGNLSVRRGRDKSKLTVTGTLDMAEFFSPRFDLNLTGKDVYFSTALKEIEAVGTADLAITGQDTIGIRGSFVPEPGGLIIRKELGGPDSYIVRDPDEGTILLYNIHVPFHTGAWVRNTELDAEIEGEITLTAVGSEEFRYAGTVDVVSGDLIYNGYQFEIEEGSVTFEPSQFNPQFTLRATTEVPVGLDPLEPVDVTLILTGTLEEPSLNFSYPPTLSLTDSDLLSLFTLGDPASAEGGPALAATVGLGRIMLRESEQYARRVSGLDRFQIQTGGYRNAMGSEGLRFNLGKRLSPNLYVGLQTDPTLNLNQYGYQVALRLSPTMSLEVSSRSPGLYEVNYRIKYRY